MIVRQFLLWTRDASAGRRAEAAAALARAYLHGTLGAETAAETKTALLTLLDDPSALVRRALAEAVATSPRAPRPLIVALASDEPEIACLVLGRSPVLMDADLVDCAALGCDRARIAIAGRAGLSKPVAAALAEVAGPAALVALARNRHAQIGLAACLRMLERHGAVGALREALQLRDDIAVEVRQALAARTAEALARHSEALGWISRERSERLMRESRDCATLALSDEAGEAGLARLVAHLRARSELTAGLILRALLSRRLAFVEAALADLGSQSRGRVAGLMLDPRGAGFAALYRRAGLPALLLPSIQAALAEWRTAARAGTDGAPLSRRMIACALSACEDLPFAEGRSLMALLARFEAEAAREEVREQAQAELREPADTEASETGPAPAPLLQAERPAFPVDAILAELPAAIVASYRAEQERREADIAAETVLGDLSDALVASFLAERHNPRFALPAPRDRLAA